MSVGRFVAALPILTRRRDPAATRRAILDVDAGALMVPTSYPYAAGARAIRPFVSRVLNPGRGPRPAMQLQPPGGNPTQRVFRHLDYAGHRAAARSGTRDVSGIRSNAKGARVRPWLFAGGSSATAADRSAAGPGSSASRATPCEDCG